MVVWLKPCESRSLPGALKKKAAPNGAAGGALNLLQFPTLNHRCPITNGVREEECRRLLLSFFEEQRAKRKTGTSAQPLEE